MLQKLAEQAKAIAGAAAAGLGSTGAIYVSVPDSVDMPWYGYVLIGIANAALAWAAVYWTTNRPPSGV